MPSRKLAQSVVVTFSLVDLGCKDGLINHANPPPPSDDGAPADGANVGDGADGADGSVAAEGGQDEGNAVDPPPDTTITPTVTVSRRPDGTCWEMVHVDCPPTMACNPPPPRPVECPPDPEALPEPTAGANVSVRPDGTCWESFTVSCPPGAMCNPPPPRQVRCATPTP